jgi:2-dehydro-3-deoxyphosphogluconate aldolase/(4S)-4-hydroxy-2-oxoglutarate aldolase
MSTFTSESIVQAMQATGMIPVFYHPNASVAKSVMDACYRGGVRVFEFTNRGENAFEVFEQLLDHASQFTDLMVGIGTVMNAATTEKYIGAGAQFIVSPVLKAEMAVACKADGALWIPGCATLTEIVTARELGAEVIKLFPGSVLGPAFVSSVLPVIPGYKLMPTGGVEPTRESLSAWFKAGVSCVGMGSQLITKEILATKDWNLLQQKVADALDLIQQIRNSSN